MKKVIYLHKKTRNLDKFNIGLGILFSGLGFVGFFVDAPGTFYYLKNFFFLLAGGYYIYYGSHLMKVPRIEIDDKSIYLKNDVFMRATEINWTKIQEISFGSYLIELQLTDGKKEFVRLQTQNADTSVEIKRHIMDLAARKKINVNPG